LDEQEIIKYWNQLRKNFVYSQIIPALLFLVLIQQASNGKLVNLTDQVKYFILVVVGIIGILSFINQYSSIREAGALVQDLNGMKIKSALARKISLSQQLLDLTAYAITFFSLLSYGFLIMVIFS